MPDDEVSLAAVKVPGDERFLLEVAQVVGRLLPPSSGDAVDGMTIARELRAAGLLADGAHHYPWKHTGDNTNWHAWKGLCDAVDSLQAERDEVRRALAELTDKTNELLAEIARHHQDFDRWEQMADDATNRWMEARRTLDAIRALCDEFVPVYPALRDAVLALLDGSARPVPAQAEPEATS